VKAMEDHATSCCRHRGRYPAPGALHHVQSRARGRFRLTLTFADYRRPTRRIFSPVRGSDFTPSDDASPSCRGLAATARRGLRQWSLDATVRVGRGGQPAVPRREGAQRRATPEISADDLRDGDSVRRPKPDDRRRNGRTVQTVATNRPPTRGPAS
jgi:hypothetical protein